MPDFNPRKLSKLNCQYGAPMGRHERLHPANEEKVRLSEVRLDRGGYDSGGAYWGIGEPLYWCRSDNGDVSTYIRAWDRETAKEKLLERNPNLKFWR